MQIKLYIEKYGLTYLILFMLLAGYGFFSVKKYSKEIGLIDSDEWIYQNHGINILKNSDNIEKAFDHPPLFPMVWNTLSIFEK